MIATKRIYAPLERTDGYRILIDRLWPRGVKRADAKIDEWIKAIAPSTELRRWYGHQPERWTEFRKRYRAELKSPEAAECLKRLRALARTRKLTLLTATRKTAGTHADVLKDVLKSR